MKLRTNVMERYTRKKISDFVVPPEEIEILRKAEEELERGEVIDAEIVFEEWSREWNID